MSFDSDLQLIESLLEFQGTIILRNEFGTMELRGDDLTLKSGEQWLTIYHSRARNSERMSHVHLRRGVFGFAEILERDGGTAQMAFWKNESDARNAGELSMESGITSPIKPPFAIFFAAFYDWSGPEKRELPENRARYEAWAKEHGRSFRLH
ncbi:MAG: hypothetical protein NXI24_06140 [bacterium]|nr:hypothetical protein [bacterium]